MGESFTVKIDLSPVRKVNTAAKDVYILMVDPKKMKVIYEFKEWIRFLFSVDFCVRLVHEGAALHDMEDINILSLLKSVRIEQCPPPCSHRMHDLLLEKFNKFEDWQGLKVPRILADRIDLNSSSTNSIDPRASGRKLDSKAADSEPVRSVPKHDANNATLIPNVLENEHQPRALLHERRHDNSNIWKQKGRDCYASSEQHQGVAADANCMQSRQRDREYHTPGEQHVSRSADVGSAQSRQKGRDCFTPGGHVGATSTPATYESRDGSRYEDLKITEMHHEGTSDNQGSWQKVERGNFCSSKITSQSAQSTGECGIRSENVATREGSGREYAKSNSYAGKRNIMRPFCIADTLNALRAEVAVKEEVGDEPEISSGNHFPDVKNIGNVDDVNEQCESSEVRAKRVRKRIRKHKSKNKTENQTNSPANSNNNSFHVVNSSFQSSTSGGNNPKHIRFDDDFYADHVKDEAVDETMAYDGVDETAGNCENFPEDGGNVDVQHMKDMLVEKLKKYQDGPGGSNDENAGDGIKAFALPSRCADERLQQGSNPRHENAAESLHRERGFDAEHDHSPKSGLDELSNLRKKFSSPVVFSRFS